MLSSRSVPTTLGAETGYIQGRKKASAIVCARRTRRRWDYQRAWAARDDLDVVDGLAAKHMLPKAFQSRLDRLEACQDGWSGRAQNGN
jgi:hypothetical protein